MVIDNHLDDSKCAYIVRENIELFLDWFLCYLQPFSFFLLQPLKQALRVLFLWPHRESWWVREAETIYKLSWFLFLKPSNERTSFEYTILRCNNFSFIRTYRSTLPFPSTSSVLLGADPYELHDWALLTFGFFSLVSGRQWHEIGGSHLSGFLFGQMSFLPYSPPRVGVWVLRRVAELGQNPGDVRWGEQGDLRWSGFLVKWWTQVRNKFNYRKLSRRGCKMAGRVCGPKLTPSHVYN